MNTADFAAVVAAAEMCWAEYRHLENRRWDCLMDYHLESRSATQTDYPMVNLSDSQ